MIQVRTWRKLLEVSFFIFFFFSLFLAKGFGEVAHLDLVVCLGGDSKTTPVGAGRAFAPWLGQGHSARCTRVRLPVLRPAGSPSSPAS